MAWKYQSINLAVLGGNDPHSYGVTSHRASMNTLRPKLGGVTWSRTKNVYHKGTDLQSADAHAIASITPYTIRLVDALFAMLNGIICKFTVSVHSYSGLAIPMAYVN